MKQNRFSIMPTGGYFDASCNNVNLLKGFIFPVEIIAPVG